MNGILKCSRLQLNQLRYIQRVYRILMEVIDDFNSIFGYQMLFIIEHSTVEMLESFQSVFLLNYMAAPWKHLVMTWSTISSTAALVIVYLKQINQHYPQKFFR